MSNDRTEITLDVAGKDFDFVLDPAVMSKYINSMTQNNKIAPANNLLMNTIDQKQRAALKEFLGNNPMTTLQLAGALVEEYSPTIEISVKKRSATLNA
jgi:hypothetical protein